MSTNNNDLIVKEYNREMMKSAFASLFWSVITKKKRDGWSMKALSEKLSVNKSVISRWFSGKNPNWELNTVADLADALDLEIRIEAIDRKTGAIFNCSGEVVLPHRAIMTTSNVMKFERGLPRTRSSTTGKPVENIGVMSIG